MHLTPGGVGRGSVQMGWPGFRWNISEKKMIPILIAAAIWGNDWRGKQVISQCDNQAVVAVLGSRYSELVVRYLHGIV